MSDLDEWILKTAKDIDAKLCEQAEKYAGRMHKASNDAQLLKIQEARIELIKAIKGEQEARVDLIKAIIEP